MYGTHYVYYSPSPFTDSSHFWLQHVYGIPSPPSVDLTPAAVALAIAALPSTLSNVPPATALTVSSLPPMCLPKKRACGGQIKSYNGAYNGCQASAECGRLLSEGPVPDL